MSGYFGTRITRIETESSLIRLVPSAFAKATADAVNLVAYKDSSNHVPSTKVRMVEMEILKTLRVNFRIL